MHARDVVRLVALAAIWGSSFIFMKTLVPVLGPVLTADLRVLIAGVALVAWFRSTGQGAGLRQHWRRYFVIGMISSALPFVLFAFAVLHLPASYAAILNAATPLFSVLLSALWLGERLTALRLAGLGAGIAGVALVTRAGPVALDATVGWAIAACLAAALCYALAGIYIKRHAAGISPMAMAGWSQLFAGAALLPLVPLSPAAGSLTGMVLANLLALALLCSAAAYLLYYRLLADLGPSRASSVTFLIPLFAMLWSALFLGESITLPMLAGCALIIGGTVLVLRPAPGAAIPVVTAARRT